MEGISCIGMDSGVDTMISDGLRGVLISSGALLAYRRDERRVHMTRGYMSNDPTDLADTEENACHALQASRYIFIYLETLTNPISLHA